MVAQQEKAQVHLANISVHCAMHLLIFVPVAVCTCTDVMQEWNKPCPKKHKPITVDEIQCTRREILHQGSTTQPIPTMYDSRPPSMRTIEHIKLEQLRLNLLSVDHRCGILQQLVPSDKYLRHDHTYCSSASVTQVRSDSGILCTADLNLYTQIYCKWSR